MGQCEITENQTEQNKSHAVAAIEAHPTPPHCGFFRNDRCNLVHADLQCGVTGREIWPPERIDEVNDSERKDNARTKNHENFGGQGALPILWGLTLDAPHSMPHRSFHEIRSPAPAFIVLTNSWRNIAIALSDGALTEKPPPLSSSPIPILELHPNFSHYFLDFTLRYIICLVYIPRRNNRMLPPSPKNFRFQPNSTPQLLCSQDFARNPFLFIDLAHTLATRPNRFIDLRGFACFFQE